MVSRLCPLVISVIASVVTGQDKDRMPNMEHTVDLVSHTCGETTQAKQFNFVSPGFPVSLGLDDLSCTLSIDHGCSPGQETRGLNDICQIRVDFTEFNIQPPLLGNCNFDMFYVSANGKYPLLCGENSGHHIYLNTEGRASTDLTFLLNSLQEQLYNCPDKFNVLNNQPDGMMRGFSNPAVNINGGAGNNLTTWHFPTRRAWKLKVTQVPCSCGEGDVMKAPDGCLQHHSGISGGLKSFNYDGIGCFSNDHICDPDNLDSCEFVAGYTGQLNNLDYTACIEQEYGFCGTEYYQELETGSFSLTNTTDLQSNPQDTVVEGAKHGEACVADYLLIPGGHCKNEETHYSTDRFCGNNLGVNGIRQPIISYSKPFNLRVVTDSDEISDSIDYMNRGFHLKYHQLSCNNQSG